MIPLYAKGERDAGPDLLEPPHLLACLMELLAGEPQPEVPWQADAHTHLVECAYCRTALIFLLGIAEEADRRNGAASDPARSVLARFIRINSELEASGYERMGAYAETIVARGQAAAERRFPDTADHLRRCPSCREALAATVASLNEPEESD